MKTAFSLGQLSKTISGNCLTLYQHEVSLTGAAKTWEMRGIWRFAKNVVLEKTLESPLERKEIQPVHSEGDQPWDFFGRNDAKAETPVLWPSHAKS